MTDFRTLYQLAEAVRHRMEISMDYHRVGGHLNIEVGAPCARGEGDSVAVFFRRKNGERAPFEIVVYQEGFTIGEAAEMPNGTSRYFIGRLRPHTDTDRVITKACERLRDLVALPRFDQEPEYEAPRPRF